MRGSCARVFGRIETCVDPFRLWRIGSALEDFRSCYTSGPLRLQIAVEMRHELVEQIPGVVRLARPGVRCRGCEGEIEVQG